ncbi:hypothetical protein IRB23SM22_07150 [Alkalibacterium sp. s-m-22]
MLKTESIEDWQKALDDYFTHSQKRRETEKVTKPKPKKLITSEFEGTTAVIKANKKDFEKWKNNKPEKRKKRTRRKRNIEPVEVFREEPLKAARTDRKQALNILTGKKNKAIAVHSPIEYEEEQEVKRNFKDEYKARKQLEVPTYDPTKQTEQQYFLNRLFYDNHESETVIFQKQTTEKPVIKHFKVNNLGDYVKYFNQNEEDLHVILNSFIFKKEDRRRSGENVHMINAFLVDVDFYNKGLTQKEALNQIEHTIRKNKLPNPTFKINSGGGIYLIWKVSAVANNSRKISYLFKLIQKEMIGLFKEVGSDAQASDIARMLKLPGSINSKYESKPEVAFIDEPSYERLDFFTFRELLIQKKTTENKEKTVNSEDAKKKLREKGLKSGKNPETLLMARREDFLAVDKMKSTNEGYRNYMLFYLGLSLASTKRSDSEILKELHSFNQSLKMPLDDSEVERLDFRKESSYGEKWKFTNAEIIEKLEISADMQQQLDTLIGKEEKKKRRVEQNRKYHDKKEEVVEKRNKKEERNILIQKLKAQGHSQKEVLKLMNEDYQIKVSLRTIKTHWNS